MVLHERIRTGSDSIYSVQDWIRTEKFHSPLISAALQDGGPAKLHYRTGQWSAHQGGLVGYTVSWAAKKGGRRTALFCSPPSLCRSLPDRLFVQPAGPPFCAARRKFTFFIWKHGPPARPAHQPSN